MRWPSLAVAAVLLLLLLLLLLQLVLGMHAQASAFLAYVSANFSSFFHGAALDVVISSPPLPFFFLKSCFAGFDGHKREQPAAFCRQMQLHGL